MIKLMDWINKLVVLFIVNSLFFCTMILGVIILGIIPSIASTIKIIKLENLFELPYNEICIRYFKYIWLFIKENIIEYIVLTGVLTVLVFNIFIIMKNSLLFALFFIPNILLICFLILFLINYSFLDNESWSKKNQIKLSIVTPLIKPIQFIALLFAVFLGIALFFTLTETIFFIIPIVLYMILKIVSNNYDAIFP